MLDTQKRLLRRASMTEPYKSIKGEVFGFLAALGIAALCIGLFIRWFG